MKTLICLLSLMVFWSSLIADPPKKGAKGSDAKEEQPTMTSGPEQTEQYVQLTTYPARVHVDGYTSVDVYSYADAAMSSGSQIDLLIPNAKLADWKAAAVFLKGKFFSFTCTKGCRGNKGVNGSVVDSITFKVGTKSKTVSFKTDEDTTTAAPPPKKAVDPNAPRDAAFRHEAVVEPPLKPEDLKVEASLVYHTYAAELLPYDSNAAGLPGYAAVTARIYEQVCGAGTPPPTVSRLQVFCVAMEDLPLWQEAVAEAKGGQVQLAAHDAVKAANSEYLIPGNYSHVVGHGAFIMQLDVYTRGHAPSQAAPQKQTPQTVSPY